MSKYTDAIDSVKVSLRDDLINSDVFFPSETRKIFLKALKIADRLERAEGELKYEYALINDWFINKFDLNVEHTELEKGALHLTGMTMQTIGYLLDALADIRGDKE